MSLEIFKETRTQDGNWTAQTDIPYSGDTVVGSSFRESETRMKELETAVGKCWKC